MGNGLGAARAVEAMQARSDKQVYLNNIFLNRKKKLRGSLN